MTASPGRAERSSPAGDRVAAPAAEDDVDRPAPQEVAALVAHPDPGDLAAIGARLEVRQRAHPRVERRAALAVEVRDDVGQVGLARRAVESGGQAVPHRRRGPDHDRRGGDPGGRQPPPMPHAGTSRPPSSRSTRSAMPAAARSCVTSTTARPSSAPAAQQAQHLGARLDVEVAGRLVGEQDGGIVDERPRDREALLLAAGELGGERGRDGPQPEPVDQLAAAPLGVRVRAAHARGEQHVRLPGELGQQVEELEDEADPAAPQCAQRALGGSRHALPADLDRPAVRAIEPAEQVQQRRLARARAPEHRDDLARGDLEIRAVEHAPRRPALAEALHQPLHADGGHRMKVRAQTLTGR